jgi:hypothetical protein
MNLTVSSEISRWNYTGNGATLAFAYTTKIFAKTDLDVYVATVLQTVDTHYTVSGIGSDSGGNVTFLSAPANGAAVAIVKDVPYTQEESLPLGGDFASTTVEDMADKLTILLQQSKSLVDRSLRQTDTDSGTIGRLPALAARLGKFLRFNLSTGDPEAAGLADIGAATAGTGIAISSSVISLDPSSISPITPVAADKVLLADASASDAAGTASITDVVSLVARKQGLETIWVPAAAMTPTVSNGCAALAKAETTSGRPDMVVLDFDASADEHAQFQISMPKSWDEGTITFQVFHTTTATDTDGVAWGLQAVACSDGDTIDVAYGTPIVVTDAYQSTAEDLYVTAVSSAVTVGGSPAAGDAIFFRIFRDVSDAADTATEDARLIGVKIFFTTNAADDT